MPANRADAYLFVGRCLAQTVEPSREALERWIVDRGVDWDLVLRVGDQELVLPLLFWNLKGAGLLELLPEDVRNCLEGTYELNELRNRELRTQISDLSGVLNEVSVEPLLLKGSAVLCAGIYDDAGLRMMNDVDVLVPKDRLDDCVTAMKDRGYREHAPQGTFEPGSHHHYQPMVCDDYSTAVELHVQPSPRRFTGLLHAAEMWEQAVRLSLETTATALIPSPTHFALLSVIHTQLSRERPRLYHVYDTVAIRRSRDDEIAWDLVRTRFDRAHHGRALRAHLYMAERLFGQPFPTGIRPSLSTRLWWLGYVWCLKSKRWMKVSRTASHAGHSIGHLWRNPDLRRSVLRPRRWIRVYRQEMRSRVRRDTW